MGDFFTPLNPKGLRASQQRVALPTDSGSRTRASSSVVLSRSRQSLAPLTSLNAEESPPALELLSPTFHGDQLFVLPDLLPSRSLPLVRHQSMKSPLWPARTLLGFIPQVSSMPATKEKESKEKEKNHKETSSHKTGRSSSCQPPTPNPTPTPTPTPGPGPASPTFVFPSPVSPTPCVNSMGGPSLSRSSSTTSNGGRRSLSPLHTCGGNRSASPPPIAPKRRPQVALTQWERSLSPEAWEIYDRHRVAFLETLDAHGRPRCWHGPTRQVVPCSSGDSAWHEYRCLRCRCAVTTDTTHVTVVLNTDCVDGLRQEDKEFHAAWIALGQELQERCGVELPYRFLRH